MRLRWLLLLAAACPLLVLQPALAAPPLHAIIQVTATPSPASSMAGTEGALTLGLKNAGDATAYNIQADLVSADPRLSLAPSGTVFLGGLGPGESSTVTPYAYTVNASAPPGFYHFTFTFTYNYNDGAMTQYGDQTITATVTVRSSASVIVQSVSPSSLQPGAPTKATITLANTGGSTLSNLDGTWTSTNNAILPVGTSNQFQLASLAPHATVDIPVTLEATATTAPGALSLTFKLNYNDATGIRLNGTSIVGLVVGGTTQFDVSVQDVSGTTATVAVTNIGVNDANGVVLQPIGGGSITGGAAVLGAITASQYTTTTFTYNPQANATGGAGPGGGRGTGGATGPGTGTPGDFRGGNGTGGRGRGNFSLARGRVTFLLSYTDTTGARQQTVVDAFVPQSVRAGGPGAGRASTAGTTGFASIHWLQVGLGAAAGASVVGIVSATRQRRRARLLQDEAE